MNPAVLSGYLAMNQLGPMLPSPQGLPRLVCDFPKPLAWSCKVLISTGNSTLICTKLHRLPSQSPHTRKVTWAMEVLPPGVQTWYIWPGPSTPPHMMPRAWGLCVSASPSTSEFQPTCVMLVALPEPFSLHFHCQSQ